MYNKDDHNHDRTDLLEAAADDVLLMLYVAGELDAASRQSFDARLASDAALRERVAVMASLDAQLASEALAQPVSAVSSRRALNASMGIVREQALLVRQGRHEGPTAAERVRELLALPRWAWGSAVAALLAVGFVVWVTNGDPAPLPQQSSNVNINGIPLDSEGRPIFRGRELAIGFGSIDPAFGEEGTGDIDDQIDALSVLATMDELTDLN